MVTSIQLGNVVTKDGKTTVTGSQSGLDTAGIVDSLVEARRQPAVKLEDANKTLDSQTTALKSLQTLLQRFQTAADNLRNPPGVQNSAKNIFEYRTGSLTATNGYTASNYLNVTVEPGASIQTFNITNIQQLARETRQETGVITLADTTTASAVSATPGAGQFGAGTFTLRTLDGSADASITLNDGDSLQSVVNKFNEVSGRTGIRANIIKVANNGSNSDYKVIYTATATGETAGFDLANATTVTSNPNNVFAQVGINTTQPAQNAIFFIDGIQIEREANSVDDVFDGITFNLQQETAGVTSIKVAVQPDTQIVSNAITSFVDVYNEFRLFASKQTLVGDDGSPSEDAVLNNNSALRSIISQVGNAVSAVVNGITDGDPARLADIGLSFDDFAGDDTNPATRNILTIDTDKLNSALSSNFDGVRGVFEYQLKSDNAALTTYKHSGTVGVSNFTLTVDQTNNIYRADYTDADGNPQTASFDYSAISTGGVSLIGKAGTPFEGLNLLYSATGDATINVTISQGIGDLTYNTLTNALDSNDGLITTALSQISDQEKRNTDEISKIDDQLTTYRQQLEDQYSSLEEALSKANNLLVLLKAQSDARNNNS